MATARQIDFLARAIVNRLEDRGLVEFGDAEAGIQIVVKTLEDNIAVADAIEREARQRLMAANGGREPTENALVEEMKKIAAERNFIL
jgi:hypothetical protein